MTEIAILEPTTLLGTELREELERRPHLWDRISLFATSEDEEGKVTEAAGGAAVVARAEPDALASADLIFGCGTIASDLPLVRNRIEDGSPGATAILLSSGATTEHGEPVISGVNPDTATTGGVLVSPDAAAVALSYLLAPLAGARGLGAVDAAATVVLPVSRFGTPGLESLLDQTRDIVAMTGERRPSVFERQLAFSLYPAPAEETPGLSGLVRRTLGSDLPVTVQCLQGAVFHGISVALFVRFAEDPGEEAVREALSSQKHVLVSGADAKPVEVPAPVDAAASDEVLVGRVRHDPDLAGGYWIWAVMDNLTRGGALNGVEVAELLQRIA